MALATNFSKKSIIFITGSSRGIGQTIAIELAKKVNKSSIFVLLARSQTGLNETKEKIAEVDKSISVLTHVVDLSKPALNIYNDIFDKVLSAIDFTGIEYGYFIHNAAHIGSLKETAKLTDLSCWRDYYDLNLFSAVLLNSVFIEKIRPVASRLTVINITSIVGTVPNPNMSMYGSGKAARDLFFKVLAVENPEVTVLNYSPGPVDTEMFNSVCDTTENTELSEKFKDIRERTMLTTKQTVEKLLHVLEEGEYKNGATVDYYGRL